MSEAKQSDSTAELGDARKKAASCPYCGQPDVTWLDKDLVRGRRDGTGYVEYHCYAAKCLD